MPFEDAVQVSATDAFDTLLTKRDRSSGELWVAIYKKCSGKQDVTYPQLLEVAIRHGWIDVQTKSIDEERYAIRFMPRREGSNWTDANRDIARRLVSEGRMTESGKATLPDDF